MRHRRDPVRALRVMAVTTVLVTLGAGVPAQAADDPSRLVDVRTSTRLPPMPDGHVPVRFSVAPADADDAAVTLLTRWRSCGVLDAAARDPESDEPPEAPLARADVVETEARIEVRVAVAGGPGDEACPAEALIRIPVMLDDPLGTRPVRDAADEGYEPVVNEVDPFDTGLRYSCGPGGYGGESFTVVELLGPGIPRAAGLGSPLERLIRLDGDVAWMAGPVRPNGRIRVASARWAEGGWRIAPSRTCRLTADSTLNQTTATWLLRGRPPTTRSKTIRMWVREEVCNGRPLYGRVAQPVRIQTPDGLVLVMSSMRETVEPDGTYIENPWDFYEGKPGVASRPVASRFIDCPGIPDAPYTVNLYQRLGDQKLYDGAWFPPRERARRGDAR